MIKETATEEYFNMIDKLKEMPEKVEKVLECNKLLEEIATEIKYKK